MQGDREMQAWCHGALSCLGCMCWSEGMLRYVSMEVLASNMAEDVPKPIPPHSCAESQRRAQGHPHRTLGARQWPHRPAWKHSSCAQPVLSEVLPTCFLQCSFYKALLIGFTILSVLNGREAHPHLWLLVVGRWSPERWGWPWSHS